MSTRRPRPPEPPARPSGPTSGLTHVDPRGRARMVDVSEKPVTVREAVARGRIAISPEALALVRTRRLKKGDPLEVARLAGIMAAKRTAGLIPLCHPLPISGAEVDVTPREDGYEIEARVRTAAQTGVEMEALTAVAVTALTIYDMVKAVDRQMSISDIHLVSKKRGQAPFSNDLKKGKGARPLLQMT